MRSCGCIDGDDLLEGRKLKIAVIGKSKYFNDYRNALVDAFIKRGIDAKAFDEIELEWKPDVILIVGPQCYHKVLRKIKNEKILKCALFTEQMFSREMGYKIRGMTMTWNAFVESHYFHLIFDWSEANCKIESRWHPRVVYFPHSFYEALNITKSISVEKKYDLCFIGSVLSEKERRYKILSYLKKRYSIYPVGEDIWGEEKGMALASSKIGLNIHQDQGLVMESPRLYEYFANNCFVLSEPMKYSFPFVSGEDFDIFYMTDMCKKIDYYLANDDARTAMAKRAYDKVKKVKIEKTIEIMLSAILMELYYYKYKGNVASKVYNLIKRLGE